MQKSVSTDSPNIVGGESVDGIERGIIRGREVYAVPVRAIPM
jgi:hypothetical protein